MRGARGSLTGKTVIVEADGRQVLGEIGGFSEHGYVIYFELNGEPDHFWRTRAEVETAVETGIALYA